MTKLGGDAPREENKKGKNIKNPASTGGDLGFWLSVFCAKFISQKLKLVFF